VGSRLWYSFCLDWFPDSGHVLVPSIRGAELQYWKVPLNGAPEVRLPLEFPVEGTTGYGAGHVLQSTVSLRGARLAAVVFRHASDIQRLECESSAGACKPAPFYGSSRTDEEIHVSPNGQWIAFASTRSGSREIWRARPDGSGALQLTSLPEVRSGSPHWSPDSQWLAFDAPYLGRQAVYLVAAEGGTARRLTEEGSNKRPGFSADGKWIYVAGSDECIWEIPAAGGQMQKVTRAPALSASESSDGRWVYFFGVRPNRSIFRMPAGGGEEQLVFSHPGLQSWALADRAVFAALWESGQGSSIVRVDLSSLQSREVYRFPLDNPRFNILANKSLAVSPDERSIYAIGGRSPEGDILMIDNFR
jgi:dipeptidyl aminopeptidase/acylaminoacyl peptidase